MFCSVMRSSALGRMSRVMLRGGWKDDGGEERGVGLGERRLARRLVMVGDGGVVLREEGEEEEEGWGMWSERRGAGGV